jgi:ankyrin repeat protein
MVAAFVFSCAPRFDPKDFLELCKTGTPDQIRNALKAGSSVKDRTGDGRTPLMHAAAFNQNPEVIAILLDAGASINDSTKYGSTALIWAANAGKNPGIITVLLKAGADAMKKDSTGRTALDYAQTNVALTDSAAFEALKKASGK